MLADTISEMGISIVYVHFVVDCSDRDYVRNSVSQWNSDAYGVITVRHSQWTGNLIPEKFFANQIIKNIKVLKKFRPVLYIIVKIILRKKSAIDNPISFVIMSKELIKLMIVLFLL